MRPSTWPFLTLSPSSTGRSTRSPDRFEEIFTVVDASTFPAPMMTRLMVPFFTFATWTSVAGGGRSLSPATVMPTTASTSTPAINPFHHVMASLRC